MWKPKCQIEGNQWESKTSDDEKKYVQIKLSATQGEHDSGIRRTANRKKSDQGLAMPLQLKTAI